MVSTAACAMGIVATRSCCCAGVPYASVSIETTVPVWSDSVKGPDVAAVPAVSVAPLEGSATVCSVPKACPDGVTASANSP